MSAWFALISVARYCLSRCVGLEGFPESLAGLSSDAIPTPFSISSWRFTSAMSDVQRSDIRILMDEGRGWRFSVMGLATPMFVHGDGYVRMLKCHEQFGDAGQEVARHRRRCTSFLARDTENVEEVCKPLQNAG